jgi:hypothetical protein
MACSMCTLQRESDELKLYLAAVMRLMVAKKATADEIKAVVAAVDREDGVADNRFTGAMERQGTRVDLLQIRSCCCF